ncbi:MAG: hypothetical protein IKO80_10065 [Lachnospiraceae bacterium]|nr:hypothetical protein [Lachnospiraceae bacterium]
MGKRSLIPAGMILMFVLAACGTKTPTIPAAPDMPAQQEITQAKPEPATGSDAPETAAETAEPAAEEADAVEAASDTDSTDNGILEEADYQPVYADYIVPYEYTGTDPLLAEVHRYIVDTYSGQYPQSNVSIPVVLIAAAETDDPADIRIYGDFWILNYNYENDTLFCASGGSYPGCIHLKSEGDVFTAVSMDVVGDGSDYTPSAKRIFGDHYEIFTKITGDQDLRETIRRHTVEDYVLKNGLAVFSYKDYGWDPVPLHTDAGLIEDFEIPLTKGAEEGKYTFSCGDQEYSAVYTKDHWKIIDSCGILSTRDMRVICDALISEHPVHGSDKASFRSAQDMAFEWLQHNQVCELITTENPMYAAVKDVDFDPADQGRTYMELIADRLGVRIVPATVFLVK